MSDRHRKAQQRLARNKSDETENKENQSTEAPVEAEKSIGEESNEPIQSESEEVPASNFAEAAAKVEAQGIEPVAPVEPVKAVGATRGVLPDKFGNNVKGERICSECGIKESETLAKNPRYSFCKGKCVNCYGKTERKTTKPEEMTVEQITEKINYYSGLLKTKQEAQGRVEGSAIENVTIVTENVTIVEHGASLDSKADELANVDSQ